MTGGWEEGIFKATSSSLLLATHTGSGLAWLTSATVVLHNATGLLHDPCFTVGTRMIWLRDWSQLAWVSLFMLKKQSRSWVCILIHTMCMIWHQVSTCTTSHCWSHPLGDTPLRHLVYRVLDLPSSMRTLVYDYGSLHTGAESVYIKRIVENHVNVCMKVVVTDILLQFTLVVFITCP